MKREGVCRALCMLLALPSAFSFTYLLRLNQNFTVLNHSLTSILLWWACWRVLEAAAKRANRRLVCVCAPLGLLFSFFMVAGAMVMQYGTARLFQLKTWIGIVCAWPLAAALCALFIGAMPKTSIPRWPRLERFSARIPPRRFFLLCWALIFAAWVPGLIASYPGVYGYDCIYQIDWYMKGAISTHHPLLHTWWLGLCVVTLGGVLGSLEAGMCVYSVSQMLLFSASFASILSYLRRRGAGAVMGLVCLLLFMLVPTNAILSFSGTKDVAFSAFVTWTLLWLLEAAQNPARLKRPRAWAGLVGLGLGMCVFRNQGIYVFVFALLIGLLVMPGTRLRLLSALCAVTVLFAVYQGPVSTWMKADRTDNVREALSVPIVQLARARVRDGAAMDEGDRAAIEAYLPAWSYYDDTSCGISDPVKNSFNTALFRENPSDFFRLWLRVGREHFEAYVDAFLRLTVGWWYPDMTYRDWAAHHPYYEYNNTDMEGWVCLKRSTPACLRWLASLYGSLSDQNAGQKVPVLSLLISVGLAAWVMLLFIAWAIYERRFRLLLPAALLFGLYGTLLLGPVVLLRYGYPLLMAVPALIGVMRGAAKQAV